MQKTAYRYAVYAVPPRESALWQFGCAWLGRDPEGGPTPELPDGLERADASVVEAPCRYGFHGTLKPPFRLRGGLDSTPLFEAVGKLAATMRPVRLDSLTLRSLGKFLAIVPTSTPPALSKLAARCVEELDHFREPADGAELARRRAAGLSPRQEDHLMRWGYPYVMDEFRFHLTLTGRLDAKALAMHEQKLRDAAGTSGALGPVTFREIGVFAETAPNDFFRLLRRVPLGG